MKWFEECYSRLLIDSHITEDDPSFMAKFDPATYVAMVKKAGVESSMVYACCHNGNCYYPTKVGHMHKNLNGRDVFGETVALLRKEGIVPIAYYTTIYHNDSAKSHPSWRRTDCNGDQNSGRYWLSCSNNAEYREFTKRQIGEIISYDIEGIFVDMTFWPGVCVCSSCRERYLRESNREIPSTVDWEGTEWVSFVRTRERWMAEFTNELTTFVKGTKPDLTVTHQFAPVLSGWPLGQSPAIASACDYTSGDFYGGKYQHSLGSKVLAAFSNNIPYEFMTSRCVNLGDHTSMKSADQMFCEVAMTLANGGAYFFIDAINPDGTLVEDVYERLGSVAQDAKPYKECVQAKRPVLSAAVGLYFSMQSHIDEKSSGMQLKSVSGATAIMSESIDLKSLRELLGTSIVLTKANIPYRILVNEKLDTEGLKTVIVNNAAYMSTDEVEKLRAFVRDGGTLIATGLTSLYNLSGETSGDFQLSDIFGVSYSGKSSQRINYLTYNGEVDNIPAEDGAASGRPQYVVADSLAPLVRATTATVLAGVSEMFNVPGDPDKYASIHSNPPGPLTEYAALTVNSFGKGRCIYLYSSLLATQNHAQQKFGEALFEKYAASGIVLESNAPSCVEVSLLRSTVDDSYILCFVNWQKDLPNVPVRDVSVSLRLPNGASPKECIAVSDRSKAACLVDGDVAVITVSELHTVEMVAITI